MRASRTLLAFVTGLALGLVVLGAARAYVRIQINGKELSWPSPTISWNLHFAGSQDLPDGSHEFAISKAFESWEDASGSKIAFTRGADVTNGPSAANHVVMFDEINETGYFPNGSGIVALTPISYDVGTGTILDADVIFNAKDYTWSVNGAPNTFDVQDVITHELGHFIGLDHTPSVTGTMWPYVSFNQWLHRTLTLDDRNGAIALAPMGTPARLTGIVRRAGAPVPGASVHAIRVADGLHVCNALAGSDGVFEMKGMPAGDYYIYATPLEGSMSSANLTGNGPVSTAFAPAFLGGFSAPSVITVNASATTNVGNLNVFADRPWVESTSGPVMMLRGETKIVTVYGSGFEANQMSFVIKSPFFTVSNVESGTSWARASVTTGIGTPYGAYDVYVRDSAGIFEAASALIEVNAPAPTLLNLSSLVGNAAGGESITLTGTKFQDGAAVLFGGFEAAAVNFVDENTLAVTTPLAVPGDVDVSVHNPDGQSDVLNDGYSFTAQPVFTQLFPTAGHEDGGTTVLINGASFAVAVQVFLDGQVLAVTWLSPKLLRVVTPAHAPGAVSLLLRNPVEPDTVVDPAFEFVDTPDPKILAFTPGKGPKGGGTKVALTGINLGEINEVRFGADPVTALGGKLAASMSVITAGRVEATTASQSTAGEFGIVARTSTGQGAFASGFTFEGSASTNPGGSGTSLPGAGGCGGVIGGGVDPRSARGELLGFAVGWAAWMLLRRRHQAGAARAKMG
ncbi:MAG: IPT/TIG domain-containing protein [Planctomycetota bacterium]|nr:IPT/TIG domain-containing protein [Planctomycetota bacterium]